MKILLFSRSMPVHGIGGMERVAADIVTGLADRGHSIHIVTTRPPMGIVPPISPPGVTIEYVPGTLPGRYSRQWWRGSRAAFLHHLKKERFDVIFSVSAGARSVLPVSDGVPSIMQAHGTSLSEFLSKLRSHKMRAFITSWWNFFNIPNDVVMFRRFTKIVAVGQAVKNSLQIPLLRSAVEDRLAVIPNGVDTDRFFPDCRMRERTRGRLRIPADAQVLVWSSRLHRQKGCHLAIAALSSLRDSNIVLLVLGDGPERRSLQEDARRLNVADRVVFAGNVEPDLVQEWLAAGDAFVFTTLRDEGLPLNVLEAMAMNLPCVLSRRLLSVIEGVENVRGVYPVDPLVQKNIAAAFVAVMSTHGTESRTFIQRFFSKEMMVSRYETLLAEVAANGRAV